MLYTNKEQPFHGAVKLDVKLLCRLRHVWTLIDLQGDCLLACSHLAPSPLKNGVCQILWR